ncbi:MAG TPA: hypothetical protein VGR00_06645, partial [Thermoanaerobaculia bacterium]|nr:hypothetical protein [Thermoanaerobaculia bacterium]
MAREPFAVGHKLLHRFNPDLGPGLVLKTDGRRMVVLFPKTGARLTMAANDTALKHLELSPGTNAQLDSTGEKVVVAEKVEGGYRLEDGREVSIADLWPLSVPNEPLEKLA